MRKINPLFLFFSLILLATSCGTEYFKIDSVPHPEELNPKVIPAEGYEGWFHLVHYVFDEDMQTRTQMGQEFQCYRYRINYGWLVGEESNDCSYFGAWISIPRNNTGKEREITIEVKLAEKYHDPDKFNAKCNDPNNKFGEWIVAWEGIQECFIETDN